MALSAAWHRLPEWMFHTEPIPIESFFVPCQMIPQHPEPALHRPDLSSPLDFAFALRPCLNGTRDSPHPLPSQPAHPRRHLHNRPFRLQRRRTRHCLQSRSQIPFPTWGRVRARTTRLLDNWMRYVLDPSGTQRGWCLATTGCRRLDLGIVGERYSCGFAACCQHSTDTGPVSRAYTNLPQSGAIAEQGGWLSGRRFTDRAQASRRCDLWVSTSLSPPADLAGPGNSLR